MPEAPHEQPWPMSVVVQLGKQLAEVLVRAAQMPSSLAAPRSPGTLIPVLYHVYTPSAASARWATVGTGVRGGRGLWVVQGLWAMVGSCQNCAVAPDLVSGSGHLRGPRGPPPRPLGQPPDLLCPPRPQIGILKPHPAFTQLLETAAERTLTFESTDVPMLCPPLPWTSPHSGAFLLSPTKMMRSVEGSQQHQLLLERCPPAELHGALDALTQLGNCAWRVNGRVLDLVLQLFADKGCPRLGVPAPPSEAPRPPEGRRAPKRCLLPEVSPAEKAEMRRELARRLKVAREMQSLRADALYTACHWPGTCGTVSSGCRTTWTSVAGPIPAHRISTTWAATWPAHCWSSPRAARSARTASTGSRSIWSTSRGSRSASRCRHAGTMRTS